MFSKTMLLKLFTTALLFLIVFTSVSAQAAEVAKAAGDAAAGKATYDMMCVSCHGATGKGDGIAAVALEPKPRDLSNAEFLDTVDDAYITKIVKEGGPAVDKSPLMPALGAAMTEVQLVDLVAYVRTLTVAQDK